MLIASWTPAPHAPPPPGVLFRTGATYSNVFFFFLLIIHPFVVVVCLLSTFFSFINVFLLIYHLLLFAFYHPFLLLQRFPFNSSVRCCLSFILPFLLLYVSGHLPFSHFCYRLLLSIPKLIFFHSFIHLSIYLHFPSSLPSSFSSCLPPSLFLLPSFSPSPSFPSLSNYQN